ncbi:MAG: 50S ribosomal protein L4 [Mariniblastus sp.]|jgi:large subunit ribosomal protein L4|nr:50S ribosomal protein L4 [Mariniblastus sp.]
MASLPVYDKTGKEVGKYEIDPADIASSINKQLLHDVVVMYQASRRQGSHQTKTRSEVAGSTKKLYRQKGTGNARAGSRRSNIRRGGGHGFAKRNRDYSYRLPKKAVRLATRMAMAGKIQDEQVLVLDSLSMESPQTKEIAGLLKALDLQGKSALITTAENDAAVYKSARNIQRVEVSRVSDLNALAILRPHRVLITRDAMDAFKEKAKS